MKTFIFILSILFFASCTNVVQIVSTGEKVEIDASPYIRGDTIILYKTLYSSTWNMDTNWLYTEDHTSHVDLSDSTSATIYYRKAVVLN